MNKKLRFKLEYLEVLSKELCEFTQKIFFEKDRSLMTPNERKILESCAENTADSIYRMVTSIPKKIEKFDL
jgi:hypothetical protein